MNEFYFFSVQHYEYHDNMARGREGEHIDRNFTNVLEVKYIYICIGTQIHLIPINTSY